VKYIQNQTIQTVHEFVDLEPGDYVFIKLSNGKHFGLSYSLSNRKILLSLVGPGDVMEKTPFLEISQQDMEDLNAEPIGTYTRITFPSKLFAEVKKRLKGLPIPM